MDVFVLCVLRLAVTMINENLIHQKKQGGTRKNNIYSFGDQATNSIHAIKTIYFFFRISTYINIHTYVSYEDIWGDYFSPFGFFPCLTYEPI